MMVVIGVLARTDLTDYTLVVRGPNVEYFDATELQTNRQNIYDIPAANA